MFGHHGTKEQQHIFYAQLLEQHAHTCAGHGQRRGQWWLQCLFVTSADGKAHLWSPWRWNLQKYLAISFEKFSNFRVQKIFGNAHLNTSQNVSDQSF